MSAVATGNVVVFAGRRARPAPALDPVFERTAARVADIPAADLLDAAHLSLSLAQFNPGTVASYGCCMKALLCLSRLLDAMDGRSDA